MRWMVRKDALDLGVWPRVSPAKLIVPLDTHVIRVGRCLRLTKIRQSGLAHGPGDHGLPPGARSRRPGEIRLLAVSSRNDERVRLQSDAG
jgi:hypothetical protein